MRKGILELRGDERGAVGRALLSRREICLPRMDGWMPKEPFSSMTDRSAPLCARSSFPSFPGSFVRSFAVVPSSPIECDRRLKRPEEITTNRVSGPDRLRDQGWVWDSLYLDCNSTCTEEERRPFLKNDPMPNPDRREGDPLIVNLTESPRLVARPPISLIAQVHLRHRKPNTGRPTRHGHRATLAV